MLKYWLNTNTQLNAVTKATQYLPLVRSIRTVVQRCVMSWRQMHWVSTIGRGHWVSSSRALGGCGRWVIS